MQFNRLSECFFIFILIAITYAFFNVLSPYFSVILWAIILTIIFYPIKDKIRTVLGERDSLASLLTIAIICLIVFVPLTIIISSLAVELNTIYTKLQHKNTHFPEIITWLFAYLPDWVRLFLAEHNINNAIKIQQKLSEIILEGGQYLAGSAFLIGKDTLGFTISLGIMLHLLFFLLKDGLYLVYQIFNSLPLSNFDKQHLLAKFAAVTRATIKGTIVIAIIHGISGGVIFYIIGIDGSVFWGSIISFLSLMIPIIGSAIIWIPAAIYLFVTKQLWYGLFVICSFTMVTVLIDNLLRPILVGKDIKIPDYLILITSLGGVEIYGINGFVIGPLIATLFVTCWNLFSSHKIAY